MAVGTVITRRAFVGTLIALAAPTVGTDRTVKKFVRDLRRAMRRMFHEPAVADLQLFDGVTVEATTTTQQILAQQVRQANTYTSSNFSIPANILFLRLFANIGLLDKLSTGLTCDLDVQRSLDGSTNWISTVGFGWTSYGPSGYHAIGKDGNPIDNPDPSCGLDPQAYLGFQWRVVITIPQALTLGASVEITT